MDLWAPPVAAKDTEAFCARLPVAAGAYERWRVETTREALSGLIAELEAFPTHYSRVLTRQAPGSQEPEEEATVFNVMHSNTWSLLATSWQRLSSAALPAWLGRAFAPEQRVSADEVNSRVALDMAASMRAMFYYANDEPLERQHSQSQQVATKEQSVVAPGLPCFSGRGRSVVHLVHRGVGADLDSMPAAAADAGALSAHERQPTSMSEAATPVATTPMLAEAASACETPLAAAPAPPPPPPALPAPQIAKQHTERRALPKQRQAPVPRSRGLATTLRHQRANLRAAPAGRSTAPPRRVEGHTFLARLTRHALLDRFALARGDDSAMALASPSSAAASVVSSVWPTPQHA